MSFIDIKNAITGGSVASRLPYAGGLFTVDPNQAFKGKDGGTDLLGRISRAQWNQYKSTYLPAIEAAMAEIGSQEVLNSQIARSENAVNQQYDNAMADTMNSLSGYGVSLDNDQMNSLTRRNAFDRDKALGSARNITRQAKAERDMQLIAGSASNLLSS